jgi:hypothetical protein
MSPELEQAPSVRKRESVGSVKSIMKNISSPFSSPPPSPLPSYGIFRLSPNSNNPSPEIDPSASPSGKREPVRSFVKGIRRTRSQLFKKDKKDGDTAFAQADPSHTVTKAFSVRRASGQLLKQDKDGDIVSPQADPPHTATGVFSLRRTSSQLFKKDKKDGDAAFPQANPPHTATKAFSVHDVVFTALRDFRERSVKGQEEIASETGASLPNIPTNPPPPQTELPGNILARERERGLAEERQRELNDFLKQRADLIKRVYGSQPGPWSRVRVAHSDSGHDASRGSGSHKVTYQTAANFLGNSGDANGKGKREVAQSGWAESSSLTPVDPATTSVSESGTPSAPPPLSSTEY